MREGRVGRDATDMPLNPPDREGDDKLIELAGEEQRIDQDGFLDTTQVDNLGAIGHVETYEGEIEAGVNADLPTDDESLEDLTTREFRALETDNPDVAAEEGETWVAPMDPPVVPDHSDPQGIRIAAGFGSTAMDDPYDADHHTTFLPDDDEVSARVREALIADSRTSRLADRIMVDTSAGMVLLRGTIDDVDDSDLLVEVAGSVTGVTDVRDETELPE